MLGEPPLISHIIASFIRNNTPISDSSQKIVEGDIYNSSPLTPFVLLKTHIFLQFFSINNFN